jgi:hypothetical protein
VWISRGDGLRDGVIPIYSLVFVLTVGGLGVVLIASRPLVVWKGVTIVVDKPVLIEASLVDRGIVTLTINKEFLYRLSQATHEQLMMYKPFCDDDRPDCPDCYSDRTVYAQWYDVVDGITQAIKVLNSDEPKPGAIGTAVDPLPGGD